MMNLRSVITAMLISASMSLSYGQDERHEVMRPHLVEWNLASTMAFNKISLKYGYQFHPRWILEAGTGYKYGGQIPKFLGLSDLILSRESSDLKGLSFSLGSRYYLKRCDCPGSEGFYLGPYLAFNRFWTDLFFQLGSNTNPVIAEGSGEMWEWGLGLQVGYQLVFRDRFFLNLMFMGPRFSFHNLNVEVGSQYASELVPLLEQEINERLDWVGLDPISIPVSGDIKTQFTFPNFRYSIGIGVLF
jgi:hypothetical protein